MLNFLSAPARVPVKGCELTCSICSEVIGDVRADRSVEIPYKLPCSHTFGSLCILRWLQDSPQQDCPQCRRRMVHPGCGHLIMPHSLSTAPPSIPASETPAQCIRCRGEGVVANALRVEYERLQLQERALKGIRLHLPRFFGAQAANSAGPMNDRIAELRKGFAILHERAWREFADLERRERW